MRRSVAVLLFSLVITSCGQTWSDSHKTPSPADVRAATTDDATQSSVVGFKEFIAIEGEREFSGRLAARPLHADSQFAVGLDPQEISERQALARNEISKYRVTMRLHQIEEYVFEIPAGAENRIAKQMMATGNFHYVEPDWIVYPITCPNDTHFSLQWNHAANRMRSCDAWTLHTGNPSVGIGICDTGVLTTHEDLQLHRLEGYNAVDQQWESAGGNISPVHSHGTNATGCAAANGNNAKGVAGVGWNLSHRMLRVSNISSGSASSSVLRHAAMTAVDNGDRVASVSYSGVDQSANLTTATYCKSKGSLLVWAAGNDSRNITFGNRDSDDLLVAGASDSSDNLSSFSAYGQFVDLVAPGSSVPSTGSGSNSSYVYVSGTSFACPIVAGMCAMIWSANPTLTPNQVEDILKQSCDDLGSAGVDNTYGYGRVNLYNAVTAALGGGTSPTAAFSGTPTSGTAPLGVAFSDQSSGSPTSWSWNFGDGGSSTAQNPSHTYTVAGSYTVSLRVSNSSGSDTEVKTGYISVSAGGSAPVAAFSGTPLSGTAPLLVAFTDQSANSPTSWAWDFGDGNTSTAQNPSHTYTVAGTYSVSLIVTNAFGSDSDTKTDYVAVSPGGPIGEGFILSRNSDFSTDDRTFNRSETIYIKVWSDQVDYTNMRHNWWQLKKRKDKVRQNLSNNGDGIFTANFALSGLPTASTSWTFKANLQDKARVRYRPSVKIKVN
jgi:thermitase